MKVSEGPIQLVYTFEVEAGLLWSALVEIDQMKQWFFENIPDFKAEIGFATSFPVQSGDRTFTHLWEITQLREEKSITYTWRYLEYPGDALLTFALTPDGGKTRLKLTIDVLEDFPDDIPEFERSSCIGGWNYFMDRLKKYLE